MTKELEALKDLREDAKHHLDHHIKYLNERLDIIENALKRLETLEEEKQSFDRQLEKKLKVLEIIKKKEVNVFMLTWYFTYSSYDKYVNDFENVDYNMPVLSNEQLTQEEYDLLKEVLL